jgi:hypothetical protein
VVVKRIVPGVLLVAIMNACSTGSVTTTTAAPPNPGATTTPAPIESEDTGAFGVFAVFTREFLDFEQAMGLDHDGYVEWAGEQMRSLGATWTRSNLQLMWELAEPVIGAGFDWEASLGGERVFADAAKNGVHYLAVFHEGGPGRSADRPALRDPLDDLTGFQRFVTAAVERFDGDGFDDSPNGIVIKHWQVGNEIGGWTRSGRTADDYVTWFAATAEAALEADPEAELVLTASGLGDVVDEFHARVIEGLAALQIPIGAVDIHVWGTADLADSTMDAVPEYRSLLDDLGYETTEIWSCEHGTYVTSPVAEMGECDPECGAGMVCARTGSTGRCVERCDVRGACPPALPLCNGESGLCGSPEQTEEDQARSLVYRYVVNRALGVRRIMWNNLAGWRCFGGTCGGIFDLIGLVSDGFLPGETAADVGGPRLAYHTYAMLARLTDEPVAEQLGRFETGDPDVHVYGYRVAATGRIALVGWSAVPTVVMLDVDGSEVTITGFITDGTGTPLRRERLDAPGGRATVELDPAPIWIEPVG